MPKFCATVLLALLSAAAFAADNVSAPARQQTASAQKAGEESTRNDAQIKQLLEKNPFAPAGVSGGAAATPLGQSGNAAPKGLQLNGIYCVDGVWYFALSDTVQKKSYTVKLGERYSENSPYSVDFFDDETNSVSVSSVVGTWTLTLKERDQLTAPSVVGAQKKEAPKKQTMQKPIIVNIQGGVNR